MSVLAIKGHATRGKEVIDILEMLGGSNPHNYCADCDSLCFTIGKCTNIIYYDWVKECYEDEDTLVFTLEEFLEKFPYKVGDRVKIPNCDVACRVTNMIWNGIEIEYETTNSEETVFTDKLQPYKEEIVEEIKVDIPKGYEFARVDDDKQQVVFTKIEILSRYPKTYEECCEVLFPNSIELGKVLTSGYNCELLKKLGELLICRDAYWKIAGEEMGLGKPWEPDYGNGSKYKYTISFSANRITKSITNLENRILAFPTEEMRDAFYESFKDLINETKELL